MLSDRTLLSKVKPDCNIVVAYPPQCVLTANAGVQIVSLLAPHSEGDSFNLKKSCPRGEKKTHSRQAWSNYSHVNVHN